MVRGRRKVLEIVGVHVVTIVISTVIWRTARPPAHIPSRTPATRSTVPPTSWPVGFLEGWTWNFLQAELAILLRHVVVTMTPCFTKGDARILFRVLIGSAHVLEVDLARDLHLLKFPVARRPKLL